MATASAALTAADPPAWCAPGGARRLLWDLLQRPGDPGAVVAGDFGSDSPDSGSGAPPLAPDRSAIQFARPAPVTPSAKSAWPDAAHCRQEHRDLEPYSPLYVGSMVISRVLSDRPPTTPGVHRATSPAHRVLSAAPPGSAQTLRRRCGRAHCPPFLTCRQYRHHCCRWHPQRHPEWCGPNRRVGQGQRRPRQRTSRREAWHGRRGGGTMRPAAGSGGDG